MYALVGRDESLAALRRLTSAGTNVAVSGPLGVGRTRLLEELVRTVPLPVVWVGSERVPAAADTNVDGVHDHVPPRAGWSVVVERAAERLLVRRPDVGHVLVVVDDLHLVAPAQAAELQAVAGAAWNATVITVPSDAALPRAVRCVLDRPDVERLVLGPLDEAALIDLAGAVAGRPLDLLVQLELQQRTRGLPLGVVELLLGARELGTLHPDRDGEAPYLPLPVHRLVEYLVRRIERAGPAACGAAHLLAFGAPLPTAVVAELGEHDAFRQLDRHGFVERTSDDNDQRLWLAHRLYAEVLRDSVTADARRGLLARLVNAFDRTGRTDDDVVRVTSWRLEVAGGDAQRFEQASREAYGVGQYAIASRLAARAIAGGSGFYAHLALGASLVELGRLPEGLAVLRTAGTVTGSDFERVWARIASAHAQAIRSGAWDRAEGEVADDGTITSAAARGELASYRRVLRALRGEMDAGGPVEPSRAPADAPVVAVSTASPAAGPRGRLLDAVAEALTGAARFDDARLAWARTAVTGVTNAGLRALPSGPDLIEQAHHIVALAAGPLDPELVAVRRHLQGIDGLAGSDAFAGWLATLGRVQLAMGELAPARATLTAAAAVFEGMDPIRQRPSVLAHLAYAAAQCADRYVVEDAVRRAGSDRRERTDVRVPCELADALVVDVWGNAPGARSTVSLAGAPGPEGMIDAGELAFAANHHRWALEAWHLAVRVGHPDAVIARLERLDALTGAPAVGLVLRHARACAIGSPEQLTELALEFAAAGRRLVGAEAAAQAADLGGGDRVAALAAGLMASCPGADTPALRGRYPAALTTQQRAVALLALEPCGDAEIAQRLNLSARTVGNHLGRVYRTLGVSGRAQLRRAYPASSPLFAEPSS